MERYLKIILFIIIGVLCFFIVSATKKNTLTKIFADEESAITYSLLPPITPKPSPLTPVLFVEQPSGFCLKIPVLMYHHIENLSKAIKENHAYLAVDPSYFEEQLKYLQSQGYTSIKVEALISALNSKQSLPGKSIMITLDDGYDDIYQNAYPLAKKYGMILNLMIPTGLMENPGYLTWSQIREMVSSGAVTISNHTWSHFSLITGSHDKIVSEITTAEKQLNENVRATPRILSYPYGTYNNDIIGIAKGLNYIAGFSTRAGTYQCDSYIMALPRTRIGNMPLSTYGI